MNRYRQTMTVTIDVWAEDEEQATNRACDAYFDFAHTWQPDTHVEVSESDTSFCPVNEPDWDE
jgi:acyl-CoA hydrolase